MRDDQLEERLAIDRRALAESIRDASQSIERVRALEVRLALAEDELAATRHEQEMLRLRLADCEGGHAPDQRRTTGWPSPWPRRRP